MDEKNQVAPTGQLTSVQEDAERSLHDFRKNIDANIKIAEYILGLTLNKDDGTVSFIRKNAGREMALVRTKLQEAKMWAGKCLEVLGSPFPTELRDEAK